MAINLQQPHRRYNPLTGRWVQVSPHRLDRPWQGEQTEPEPTAPSYDPDCYLCPGNARKGGAVNPHYLGVYVFENDFPALMEGSGSFAQQDPLFRVQATSGVCRVMCFSPDHGKSLPELPLAQIQAVVEVWAEQSEELGKAFAHVQVFENKGAVMGCSNPHPHGQIWATAHIPDEVDKEIAQQAAYYNEHGSLLLLDLVEREANIGERVVASNSDWLVIVPYWAAWPFETLLLPRFRAAQLPDLSAKQKASLAQILRELTVRYDNLFCTSFPYSMGWHQSPFGEQMSPYFQLHAHFFPPLLRSAAVKKFMVGYEMLAEPQRDLTPERAAEMLRATNTIHYRSVA